MVTKVGIFVHRLIFNKIQRGPLVVCISFYFVLFFFHPCLILVKTWLILVKEQCFLTKCFKCLIVLQMSWFLITSSVKCKMQCRLSNPTWTFYDGLSHFYPLAWKSIGYYGIANVCRCLYVGYIGVGVCMWCVYVGVCVCVYSRMS